MNILLFLLHLLTLHPHSHCVRELIHYTGTVGQPGSWRIVRICPAALTHHFQPI